MYDSLENGALRLSLFLVFLAFALASLIVSWIRGRQWGDPPNLKFRLAVTYLTYAAPSMLNIVNSSDKQKRTFFIFM